MSFPAIVQVHDVTDPAGWVTDNAAGLKQALAEQGAILFRGLPISSAEDFDAFSAAFGYGDFTYRESLSNAVRINLTPRVFTANEAPPDVEIYLHHEMAQTPFYPQKLFFCCLAAAESGGATPLCRSDWLWAAYKETQPEWAAQFEGLGVRYTTHMPAADDQQSGQGRSWRSTLNVATRNQAETRLDSLGYSWSWQSDDSLVTTTPALPAVMQLPDGSESFFNQVIAAFRGWKRRDDARRPVVTFGNDEDIPESVLESLVSLSREFVVPVEWQDGDVALVDNYRVMHGRYPYSGRRKRQVIVCLGRN